MKRITHPRKNELARWSDEELKAELTRRANAPVIPPELIAMRDEDYGNEYIPSEHFYYECKPVFTKDLGDHCVLGFLTKWDYAAKDINPMLSGCTGDELPFHELDEYERELDFGVHYLDTTPDVVAKIMQSHGIEERSGILELFGFVKE